MGKIVGDNFTFKKVGKIKQMLFDKKLFEKVESIDVNAEGQGFGYFSVTFENMIRRSHMHWYELTVKVLAPAILYKDDLMDYYRRVFIKKEDPVNLLYHLYRSK